MQRGSLQYSTLHARWCSVARVRGVTYRGKSTAYPPSLKLGCDGGTLLYTRRDRVNKVSCIMTWIKGVRCKEIRFPMIVRERPSTACMATEPVPAGAPHAMNKREAEASSCGDSKKAARDVVDGSTDRPAFLCLAHLSSACAW